MRGRPMRRSLLLANILLAGMASALSQTTYDDPKARIVGEWQNDECPADNPAIEQAEITNRLPPEARILIFNPDGHFTLKTYSYKQYRDCSKEGSMVGEGACRTQNDMNKQVTEEGVFYVGKDGIVRMHLMSKNKQDRPLAYNGTLTGRKLSIVQQRSATATHNWDSLSFLVGCDMHRLSPKVLIIPSH